MALSDPVAVFNGLDNIECAVVREALLAADIDAHVVEDVSQVGSWWAFGLLPQVHKSQVWIERADIERARPVLEQFVEQQAERKSRESKPKADGADNMIDVTCEDCSRTLSFPVEQIGAVEVCRHCGGFVDVGYDEDDDEDWGVDESDNPDATWDE